MFIQARNYFDVVDRETWWAAMHFAYMSARRGRIREILFTILAHGDSHLYLWHCFAQIVKGTCPRRVCSIKDQS